MRKTGIVRLSLKLYLSCDATSEQVGDAISNLQHKQFSALLEPHLFVDHMNIENNTVYQLDNDE